MIRNSKLPFGQILAGTVLLFAAWVKSFEIATHLQFNGWLLSIVLVFSECLLGLWLFSNYKSIAAKRISIIAFLAFGFLNLFHSLSGQESCGCLGSYSLPPLTMAFVDFLIAMIISIDKPVDGFCNFGALIGTLAVAATILPFSKFSSTSIEGLGPRIGRSRIVLDFELWIGKKFPLTQFLECKNEFNSNDQNYDAIFIDKNCPKCQRLFGDRNAIQSEYSLVFVSNTHFLRGERTVCTIDSGEDSIIFSAPTLVKVRGGKVASFSKL